MSLRGAVPPYPSVWRARGSEAAAEQAEEGPLEELGCGAAGLGSVRKGGQLVTREPRGVWGCLESPEDCGHASQLRQQRLQLQPLSPSRQTGRVLSPSLLPSGSLQVGEDEKRGRLPRLAGELSSEGVAGGASSLLDLGRGVCNPTEHIGRDPHPPTHSAAAPFPPCSLMVPIASAPLAFPLQEAF